ncbi:hypothetical protein C8R45DRAFT_924141 [Mycena sanguinolenta]|nr:hypothetical protein C8R45DRAFT_924141 [Mycena sanguinolenta]
MFNNKLSAFIALTLAAIALATPIVPPGSATDLADPLDDGSEDWIAHPWVRSETQADDGSKDWTAHPWVRSETQADDGSKDWTAHPLGLTMAYPNDELRRSLFCVPCSVALGTPHAMPAVLELGRLPLIVPHHRLTPPSTSAAAVNNLVSLALSSDGEISDCFDLVTGTLPSASPTFRTVHAELLAHLDVSSGLIQCSVTPYTMSHCFVSVLLSNEYLHAVAITFLPPLSFFFGVLSAPASKPTPKIEPKKKQENSDDN